MSTINELLNQQKHLQTQIDAVDPDAIKKAQREKDKESMQADIDVSIAGYDSQINNTQAYYDKRIGDTKISYEDAYQRNAVQKLINEKQIAERNANLGLTDSGLNRTQQTAAQLSYANQKGKIDLSRQSALDELNLKLTNAITTLENDKATAVRNITNNWNAYSDEQAQNTYNTTFTGLVNQYNSLGEQITDMYKADADAAAEVQKAAISATTSTKTNNILNSKYSTLGNLQGSFASNGITSIHNADGTTTYTDTITGYSVTMDKGINPFTGQNNLTENTVTARSAQKYGTFSNGYQPKGIINVGELRAEDKESDFMVNGRHVTIWQAYDNKGDALGTFWAWDGCNNEYFEVIKQGNSWGLKKE